MEWYSPEGILEQKDRKGGAVLEWVQFHWPIRNWEHFNFPFFYFVPSQDTNTPIPVYVEIKGHVFVAYMLVQIKLSGVYTIFKNKNIHWASISHI